MAKATQTQVKTTTTKITFNNPFAKTTQTATNNKKRCPTCGKYM